MRAKSPLRFWHLQRPRFGKLFYWLWIPWAIALAFLPSQSAWANMLPPTILSFRFIDRSGKYLTVAQATLDNCSDRACLNPVKTIELQCEFSRCRTFGVFYSEARYARITASFAGGERRTSRPFRLPDFAYFGMQLEYEVNVDERGLFLSPFPLKDAKPYYGSGGSNLTLALGSFLFIPALWISRKQKAGKHETLIGNFCAKLCLNSLWLFALLFAFVGSGCLIGMQDDVLQFVAYTILIESGLALAYSLVFRLNSKTLMTMVLMVNAVSLALLQFILATGLDLAYPMLIVIVEMGIVALEAILLFVLDRRTIAFSLRQAFLYSLTSNALSFLAGFLIYS